MRINKGMLLLVLTAILFSACEKKLSDKELIAQTDKLLYDIKKQRGDYVGNDENETIALRKFTAAETTKYAKSYQSKKKYDDIDKTTYISCNVPVTISAEERNLYKISDCQLNLNVFVSSEGTKTLGFSIHLFAEDWIFAKAVSVYFNKTERELALDRTSRDVIASSGVSEFLYIANNQLTYKELIETAEVVFRIRGEGYFDIRIPTGGKFAIQQFYLDNVKKK